ncbi:Nucleoid occlusion protein [uncultured Flavonifractor sp.]|uniref:ParB/RepB/Spo0J family partition protein n=1 Tax=Intestinimonas massiliensis (ex Afouda et al. 2020) TaxID=1673721 RepID=A0ABS9M5B3_9FIRM|nr:ParB/RepB/Spo0J family partition protein [Intestinimonas massiliensis (ex Afouda et al. 2020)]CUP93113.1 ParB family protein [Flavonifractor plautii]SCJ20363.1 Nucleoid occlusion protein [uncultured Flavonifractor sp.]BDE89244.1 nucleoid occlusion protein [Oscillospiraceae bacterium]MCG4525975.1 ParB/RepB/Spo0J family partition protein [Intestinimonas massiliensis (ex Afouda et al. 2020)]MCQ4805513.1 ParB/RepB/Spo0J family partition protein [Intestinimonas massiliensis (ex Afouda et al. 202
MPLLRRKGLYETGRVIYLHPDVLHPNPNQPRKRFSPDGLEELAASIREHGVLQPLTVRKVDGSFELVSGERRLRAARMAGLSEVPCIVIDVDGVCSSLLALVENLQRRDLDFLEEAMALDRLIHTYDLSQEEAARRIGKSQSAVANKLRLLKLSPRLLDRLRQNGLTERHARALLRLETEEQQWEVLEYVIDHHLTVAQTEAYIEARLTPPPPRKKKPTFILKDVRLFLNTVTKGLSMMKDAGVNAEYGRQETEDAILLTIKIPKAAS